jgi:hypothetical protein
MSIEIEKVKESDILIYDFGSIKLYKVVENKDDLLEKISEQSS